MTKFGYIYKITLPDNRFYIGKKESPVVVPYYFGSGTHINRWFKKNFGCKSCACPENIAQNKGIKRQVLAWASNRECLKCLERIYVGNLWKNNKRCLNLSAGGKGGTYVHTEEQKRIVSEKMKKWMANPMHNGMFGKQAWNKGKRFSDESRKKMSDAQKSKIGCLNSFFGHSHNEKTKSTISQKLLALHRHWYTNGKINILSSKCPDGFILGRTMIVSTTAD